MGVEQDMTNQTQISKQTPKEKELPASWDAYADLKSPFACFAPRSTTWSFSDPAAQPENEDDSSVHTNPARAIAPSSKQTIAAAAAAPAFALTGQQPRANSLCPNTFPSGSDFFLKGKRNTSLADSSPEADQHSASQSKKLKLPPPPSSSDATSKRQPPPSTTSLRSAALEKFNSNPSLQPSMADSSNVSTLLSVHPPSSKGSSVCADNGENDEAPSSALSTTANPSPPPPQSSHQSLGFSAFATSTGFGDSSSQNTIDWSQGQSTSVFDQQPPSSKPSDATPSDSQQNNTLSEWGGALQTGERKTHLALSAELSQEDKHEGFSATEVITGEENEELIKSVRCKIFTLAEDQSWRERGTGGLRLLRTKEEPYRYRLIMRADAVLRVLLNVPIFKGFSYRPTQDKFLTFASTVGLDPPNGSGPAATATDGKEGGEPSKAQFHQYLCRFGKPEARQEIIDSIEECLKELRGPTPPGDSESHDEVGNPHDASELV